MNPLDFFASDYFESRKRFVESAEASGARTLSYPIDVDSSLTIDVAIIDGPVAAPVLVLSSGVHGVEGPLGSAAQLAMMQMIQQGELSREIGYVLIHAINPYGFVHHRRWNEDNVDLNRNFRSSTNRYMGCPDGYRSFEATLNPKSPPSRLEPFWAKAFWNIAKHGVQAIKEAVATGQYEYPQGLFFGGKQECCSSRILREQFADWVGDAIEVVHLDVHTGLGRFGDYQLLVERPPESSVVRWYRNLFGEEMVEDSGPHETSYDARGTFGLWTAEFFSDRDYRFATLEFGTHPIVRVLAALRAENRVHHFARNDPQMDWAREELRECFCPASPKWRTKVMKDQIEVIQKCASALVSTPVA
ncbi:MAG: DUF2817 domain-containing protein [Planctomycetota bacterium]